MTSHFVLVIGLHSSGSSAIAGVLKNLGIFMGDVNANNENLELMRICQAAVVIPFTHLNHPKILEVSLARHFENIRYSAEKGGFILAAQKYPTLCAMGDICRRICGSSLRVIHASRPLEKSILSLQSRIDIINKKIGCKDIEEHQSWLWHEKMKFLSTVEHFDCEYQDLVDSPDQSVDGICTYLGLQPSANDRMEAIKSINPFRRHF